MHSVPVPMMQIGEMRVAMHKAGMRVRMRMRSCRDLARQMVVVMMAIIVPMAMGVRQRFMPMIVFMTLGEVQPDAGCHQRASDR